MTGVDDLTFSMQIRLAVLMFLQYAVPGAYLPLLSLWLAQLGFTPMELAWCSTTSAMASLFAPLVVGQIADRWVPAERCIAFCAFAAGGLLWLLAELREPWPVFLTSLAIWSFFVPVLTLGVSLSFRHLAHPERDFGKVRLWGTVGWIIPGWLLSIWFSDGWLDAVGLRHELSDSIRLSGILAWALSFYALTLPHTPPLAVPGASGARGLVRAFEAPLIALRLCRRRPFAVYCACSLGVYMTIPFSAQLTPLLLQARELPLSWTPSVLTIAQSTEVITLALLPMFLLRFQVRGTMLLGLVAWSMALTILTIGSPLGLLIGSLGFNGICICCFLVTGQLYVNRQARADIRASAQALLTFMNGIGLLMGHLAVGVVRHYSGEGFHLPFGSAAALASLLVVLFAIGFTTETASSGEPKPLETQGKEQGATRQ